jgi:hypothetical protein
VFTHSVSLIIEFPAPPSTTALIGLVVGVAPLGLVAALRPSRESRCRELSRCKLGGRLLTPHAPPYQAHGNRWAVRWMVQGDGSRGEAPREVHQPPHPSARRSGVGSARSAAVLACCRGFCLRSHWLAAAATRSCAHCIPFGCCSGGRCPRRVCSIVICIICRFVTCKQRSVFERRCTQ